MFRKILIANRGEIAVRVIRACRELGIVAAAVYSEVDRKALHVLRADEAHLIGPSAARESYLCIERIIATARRCGAEAIHPGYGFLSENAEFAQACQDAGLVFIGPSAQSMEMMGSKTRARQTVGAAGVPVVPGSSSALAGPEEAAAVAAEIGYPVMVKASAGGGGKGLRRVANSGELASALRDAQSEALNAFGDGQVYLEKFLERPRHIEIQVLGDHHGNMVYLGERDCSIQRRHQKVVEECPSPFVDAGMRRRMGEAAVCAAKAAGYYNAGTVEFLVDTETRQFYFLEMNTRLQVEHPVTELVTGLDLVKLQLAVAAGERLPFDQRGALAGWRGAALECRIYAEDPDNNFFPSPGTITALVPPGGPGVRADSGVYRGWTVPLEYDPLISKIITWGQDRNEAIIRMRRALDEYFVVGIKTTIPFFKRLLEAPEFLEGRQDTGFLDLLLSRPRNDADDPAALEAAAIAASCYSRDRNTRPAAAPAAADSQSNWKREGRRSLLR